MRLLRTVCVAAALCTSTSGILAQVDGDPAGEQRRAVSASSSEFKASERKALSYLASKSFDENIRTPSLGAMSQDDFRQRVAAIMKPTTIAGVEPGDRGSSYDVIIQSGHYGRRSGAVGTAGRYVSEQALNAYINDHIARRLRTAGLKVLVLSADDYLRPTQEGTAFNGLKSKVFLAIHADGNVHPCSTGPSLAYASQSSMYAMHAIGYALSSALGYDYGDYNKDNFTANEAHYYMYKYVQAPRLAGLLEVGELTCPKSEDRIIQDADIVSGDVANALQFITTVSMPS